MRRLVVMQQRVCLNKGAKPKIRGGGFHQQHKQQSELQHSNDDILSSTCTSTHSSGKLETKSRRVILGTTVPLLLVSSGLGGIETRVKDLGVARAEDAGTSPYKRSPLGVPYEDIESGDKTESVATEGDIVEIDYILRRSNGYFIYGTVPGVSFQPLDIPAEPFQFKIGSDDVIPGLSDVVKGMRKGSKRRALIPPRLGYTSLTATSEYPSQGEAITSTQQQKLSKPKQLTLEPLPPTFATKRQLLNHCDEPLLFEIEVIKVKH